VPAFAVDLDQVATRVARGGDQGDKPEPAAGKAQQQRVGVLGGHRSLRALRRRALADPDLGRGRHRFDLAEGLQQEVEVVDAVALQPATAHRRVLNPGERARPRLGVVGVHQRHRHHAWPADDLAHTRENLFAGHLQPATVVDHADHARRLDLGGNPACVSHVGGQRLLAQDVQAAACGGDRDVGV